MFATARRRASAAYLAGFAFCFGLAFSLSASAVGCSDCWDRCFAERRECRQAGNPSAQCQENFQDCGNGCGCPIP
ncbi:hypothetical protein SAMN04487939_101627 [Lysobacter sp. yr284]|uniref:hypothetical protein n=1 Tax=Lysobacter TaxID=68 RepID=UPI00089871B5|nr:hypothetical protein [Lysobacter sp. yr284]SDY28357.1 hypothetical protein SAMN04487939_101627 [Lysobacter sp. yr284]